jgi:hypothetical protein
MASKNKLLGSGKPEEVEEEVPVMVPVKAPAWRYHVNCPKGKVFKTDEELAVADANGWKDHPGKVQLLPGSEDMFESD